MIVNELALRGAYLIELEKVHDHRGFFARAFCQHEFEEHGLDPRLVQCNVSFNPARATMRGMHYQVAPHQEVKLVRCTRGAIFDVIVDLRRGSCTYAKWFGAELTADSRTMLYVPRGFAHGYLTLCDDTEVFYQVSEFYHPESERGVRFDDPALDIKWPGEPAIISDKDRLLPLLAD